MIITIQESLDMYSHGGPWPDIRFLTKWGIWLTWLCFLIGMFALEPIPQGDRALLKSYKYSPFRAWKWHLILFECAFTLELVITGVFWSLLYTDVYNPNWNARRKASMIMDHSVPLGLLLFEYLFLANPVFLRRHVYAIGIILILYLPFNLYYTFIGKPPYAIMDWQSATGVILPLVFLATFLLIFIAVEFLTRKKLFCFAGPRNATILHVLESK